MIDANEILKNWPRKRPNKRVNVRAGVRDVTLNALRGRELSLEQIRQVLKSVTEGVSMGAAKPVSMRNKCFKIRSPAWTKRFSKPSKRTALHWSSSPAKGRHFANHMWRKPWLTSNG